MLLEAYVPVLMIGFCIQLLLPFLLLCAVSDNTFRFIPLNIRSHMNGILWPGHWYSLDYAVIFTPAQLLNMPSILSRDVLHPIAVLMSFGLCSPALAILVVTVTVVKCIMWMWALCRFVSFSSDEKNAEKVNAKQRYMSVLSESLCPVRAVTSQAFWLIFVFSTAFMSFLYWDTVDDVSWVSLVVVVTYALVLLCVSYIFNARNKSFREASDMTVGVEVGDVSKNPLNSQC